MAMTTLLVCLLCERAEGNITGVLAESTVKSEKWERRGTRLFLPCLSLFFPFLLFSSSLPPLFFPIKPTRVNFLGLNQS